MIKLRKNLDINLYKILTLINENSFLLKNEKYFIFMKEEKYMIHLKKINVEFYLDELLIRFFEKISNKCNINRNQPKKFILIYDKISYELRLIIQQAALINGINIINMIDTNKALRFFTSEIYKKVPSSSISNYTAIILIHKNYIDLSIYTGIKKLFEKFGIKFFIDINLKFKLKDNKSIYILIDNMREKILLEQFKKFIKKIVKFEIGEQKFQNVEKIYAFNADNINLNKYIFLGASKFLKLHRLNNV